MNDYNTAKQLTTCRAEPVHPLSEGTKYIFGYPVFKNNGTVIMLDEPTAGHFREIEVKPETISRFTGRERDDGPVYENDTFMDRKGNKAIVYWNNESLSWCYKYIETVKPDSILKDTSFSLFAMNGNYHKV